MTGMRGHSPVGGTAGGAAPDRATPLERTPPGPPPDRAKGSASVARASHGEGDGGGAERGSSGGEREQSKAVWCEEEA